jgi:RimJ/RimL family protein N-acetyltransferase
MEYYSKQSSKNYELVPLNKNHMEILFNWSLQEKNFQCYTCRPLKLINSFDEYVNKILISVSEAQQFIYVLVNQDNCKVHLGKITLFDLNPRNHSAEFGYYLPENNRGQNLGNIMISKFIQRCFKNDELNLNKLYATTSSNNYSSIKLLEKYGFKLDGRLREHYWIDENRYDQLIYSILKQEWTK